TSGGNTGSATIGTISPGGLDHFAFNSIGTPSAGIPFGITITAKDLNNNTVSGFAGTVNLTTTAGTISPLVSGAFSRGLWSANVTVTQSGTGKTITATDAGGSGKFGTSSAFDVNAGGVDHFVIGNISTPQVAGTPWSITITAKDAGGNTVSAFSGTAILA